MKNRSFSLALLSLALCSATFADAQDVVIAPSDIHIPQGFDSNDKNVAILLTGVLPNSCIQQPTGHAKVIGQKITVDIEAKEFSDLVCIQMLVPYLVTVPLGQLKPGSYNVVVNEGKDSEKDGVLLVDKPSSQNIDNFTYANVTTVEKVPGRAAIRLNGVHPNSCMNIDRVEVVANDSGNTYAVLPIVKQDQPDCDRVIKPFVYDLAVPVTMPNEVVVFHVRTFNGNAINLRIDR